MSYNLIPTQEIIDRTVAAFTANKVTVKVVNNKEEALAAVKELLPAGVEVMTGSSTTLDQIGFTDLLKSGQHPWHNLKQAIVTETDPAKQAELRRQSVLSNHFLGSVHAITETGELMVASASGSQIPAYAFTSDNVIWVAGAQKIVPTLADCYKRITDYVFPLEDQRMKSVGMGGSTLAQTWAFHVKPDWSPRNFHLILVKEVLGF